MNSAERLLYGIAELELRSAAPELCLNRLSSAGIYFRDVVYGSEFTLRISVRYCDLERIRKLAAAAQAETEVIAVHPGIRGLLRLFRRPVLLLSLAAALAAVLILPDYVWVVTVSGNETIPTMQIIRTLEDLGVRFGTKNESIESQDVKNRLLNAVDGLQWAAVNCSGGHCQVLVKERSEQPELLDRRTAADVVASYGGTILELRVLQGEPQCMVGDTVEAGQVLVAGITDRVVEPQKSHAQAEVYALTWRENEVVIPEISGVRTTQTVKHVCNYLQLGRIRIKISGNSRICGAGCVKMISRETLTLPGGFELPVTWITETCRHSAVEEQRLPRQEAAEILQEFGMRQIGSQMIAGNVLSSDRRMETGGGIHRMFAVYACREMIAREEKLYLFGSEQYDGGTNSERGTG